MKRLIAALVGASALALAGCHSAEGQTRSGAAQPQAQPAGSAAPSAQTPAPAKPPSASAQGPASTSKRSEEMVQISRAELDQLRRACQQGQRTPGAPQAGARGTGGSGTAGKGTASAAPRARAATPIATVSLEGRVIGVSPRRIDVRDQDGSVYNLRVDAQTRALHHGRRVSLRSLREGAPVRASFAFVRTGDERARTVELLQAPQRQQKRGRQGSQTPRAEPPAQPKSTK